MNRVSHGLLSAVLIGSMFAVVWSGLDAAELSETLDEVLVVSNYPEEIRHPGKIFDVRIPQQSLRVLYYHKNVSNHPLTLQITVRNLSPFPGSFAHFSGRGGPDEDGVFVGHIATKNYFKRWRSGKENTETVPAHTGQIVLAHLIKPHEISSGVIRIERLNDAILSVKAEVVDMTFPQLSTLVEPLSNEVPFTYGLFPKSYKTQTLLISSYDGLQEVPIGDAPYLKDTAQDIVLKGHYGIIHHFKITFVNEDTVLRQLKLLYSPRAGVSRGIFFINHDFIETGLFEPTMDFQPAMIYSKWLRPKATTFLDIWIMPQAGSNYPVNLVVNSVERHDAFVSGLEGIE